MSWDLRYDGPKQIELRTTPPDNPHIWEEPRFKDKDTRPVDHWGIQGPQRTGPLGLPGRYAVRINVGGKPYTQNFRVMKDPSIPSSDADLAASTRMQIRIRDDLDTSVAMVNRLETMRKQLEDQRKANAGKADVPKSIDDLDKKMMDVELQLLSRSDLHSDDKWYVEKYKVYMNLIWLSGEVGSGAGDVAGGAEFRPTDASVGVLADIEKDLTAAKAAYTKLLETDIKAFNALMGGKIVMEEM